MRLSAREARSRARRRLRSRRAARQRCARCTQLAACFLRTARRSLAKKPRALARTAAQRSAVALRRLASRFFAVPRTRESRQARLSKPKLRSSIYVRWSLRGRSTRVSRSRAYDLEKERERESMTLYVSRLPFALFAVTENTFQFRFFPRERERESCETRSLSLSLSRTLRRFLKIKKVAFGSNIPLSNTTRARSLHTDAEARCALFAANARCSQAPSCARRTRTAVLSSSLSTACFDRTHQVRDIEDSKRFGLWTRYRSFSWKA